MEDLFSGILVLATPPECSDQSQVISQKGMPNRELLALTLQAATLTFQKLNLGDESIFEGCQCIPAGLFQGYNFALRSLELIVAVTQIEIRGFNFLEGGDGSFPIECSSFISC